MIPGPVSGHVPVDPGGTQRQLTDAAGEPGTDAGTSFADLLAAMLAPGAAGAQLQATVPAMAEAVFERLDAAEMFNETGLFRGAAPLPSADSAEDAAQAAASPPAVAAGPQMDLDPLAALLPVDRVAAAPADGAGAVVRTTAGSGGAAGSGGSAGAVAKAVHGASPAPLATAAAVLSGNPPQSAAAGPGAADGGRVSQRTAALVAQIMTAKTGAAAAQISVQIAEGGISVMARVDRLSREERDRLRAEIGELLARHGFAGAEIILNGEAWPLPQGEEH